MENTQTIRSRISTVYNIQKAATAMKLISTVKLSKLNSSAARSATESISLLADMLAVIAGEAIFSNEVNTDHWLLRKNCKTLLIVLSMDQGFCGSFKQSILTEAEQFVDNHPESYLEVFGKKTGKLIINTAKGNIQRDIKSHYDLEGFADVLQQMVLYYVLYCDVSDVYIISGKYVNVMTQLPRCCKLLPLKIKEATTFNKTEFNIPKMGLFDFVLKKYLYLACRNIVYEHLLSELSIRVFTMDKTVRNADEMISDLTLSYNKTRQARITQELTEIVASVDCVQ